VKKALFVLVLAGLAVAGPTWLARVDLSDGRTGRDLFDSGLTVVRDYGGYCLVLAASEQLGRPELAPLDAMAPGRVWVWVLTRPDFDRTRLTGLGRIILEDGPSVLLATTESRVPELNRLPVELARVGAEPLVYSGLPAGPPPLPAVDDSLIWALVNKVNEDSVLGTIRRLQNFYTRYSTTDSCRVAGQWGRNKFIAYGCDSTATHQFRTSYAPNVIGVKKGKLDPTKIYIFDGHLDNTSDYEPDRCPGSDDNASGSTAVLEACRVFAGIDFDYTVYFILFTGEEQGLYGSTAFAESCYRRHDSVRAVLNFDMISYGRQNRDSLEVIGKTSPNCTWLVDAYRANCDTFAQLKTKKTMTSGNQYDYSDHAPFWNRGYFAFCGIERDFTPKYHTIGDTIGTLYYVNCGTNNWPMATKAIKAGVATLAKLAGARVPTGIGEGAETPLPAELIAARPALGPGPVNLFFSAPARPGARVEVYDALGRQVGLFGVGGLRSAVSPETQPGIYLFRLVDGGLTSTAKAIVTE